VYHDLPALAVCPSQRSAPVKLQSTSQCSRSHHVPVASALQPDAAADAACRVAISSSFSSRPSNLSSSSSTCSASVWNITCQKTNLEMLPIHKKVYHKFFLTLS